MDYLVFLLLVGLVFNVIQICCSDMSNRLNNHKNWPFSHPVGFPLSSIQEIFACCFVSCMTPSFYAWSGHCSRLRVIAELRHGDLFHSSNIVSRWAYSFVVLSYCMVCTVLCIWQWYLCAFRLVSSCTTWCVAEPVGCAFLSSSIEFDRDDELFATAGVSRRIKVFEFATVYYELFYGLWSCMHVDVMK